MHACMQKAGAGPLPRPTTLRMLPWVVGRGSGPEMPAYKAVL